MNNPWKVTAISMFVVLAVALVTGMVVAGFTGSTRGDRSEPSVTPAEAPRVSLDPTPPPMAQVAQTQGTVPTQAAVEACNRYAADQAPQNKTKEVLTDGAIGATGGALYGLNENRRNDERYRSAYGACMRSKGYTG